MERTTGWLDDARGVALGKEVVGVLCVALRWAGNTRVGGGNASGRRIRALFMRLRGCGSRRWCGILLFFRRGGSVEGSVMLEGVAETLLERVQSSAGIEPARPQLPPQVCACITLAPLKEKKENQINKLCAAHLGVALTSPASLSAPP
jgi:hypothetical protein